MNEYDSLFGLQGAGQIQAAAVPIDTTVYDTMNNTDATDVPTTHWYDNIGNIIGSVGKSISGIIVAGRIPAGNIPPYTVAQSTGAVTSVPLTTTISRNSTLILFVIVAVVFALAFMRK